MLWMAFSNQKDVHEQPEKPPKKGGKRERETCFFFGWDVRLAFKFGFAELET